MLLRQINHYLESLVMPNNYLPLKQGGFTFKRFFVAHDKSPMKVTTDSCLLGAWAPIQSDVRNVLDIGTGCGVIALMLAQRLVDRLCEIDAVDIEPQAVVQCQQNSLNANLGVVKALNVDVNQFRLGDDAFYDLIVTNPPYFQSAVDCRNTERQLARYTESLNYQQLVDVVLRLLKPCGVFCLVLPYHCADQFKQLCALNQLYLQHEMKVRYSADKDFSLSLMAFSFNRNGHFDSQVLCMRDEDGRYSQQFRQLLADFYLFRK
jgi:tRNA1Val (adenine37-N6)-methyltransferase